MKQVEVTILGQSYILGCPDGGESSLLEAVADVDREMSAIRDGGKVKARERIAVLAALNIAYELSERSANTASARGTAAVAHDQASRGDSESPPDVGALIHRIDEALGRDGQLL